ncbi:hypothetical protein NDU88_006404 [Pleurodeles waltl]|uniref:Uncharacterized protein n=1 Tax=Pleurodeles waltl TaxID=8319 RepID=A0AAV7MZ44_PLEWA|nr:hypothetical protein NDU88_006404 [Pleurodeles waltl]
MDGLECAAQRVVEGQEPAPGLAAQLFPPNTMSTHLTKKDASLKDLVCKFPAKKGKQYSTALPPRSLMASTSLTDDPLAEELVTCTFLETVFRTLREDTEALKREMASDVKDIKKELGDMGQRMDSLERSVDQREEELNHHRRKLLDLRNKNEDILDCLENLEHRLPCSIVCIKYTVLQADTSKLEEYVMQLF